MANQYFVFKKSPELGEEFIIENQAAAHHIFTVMRAKSGDQIRLVFTDGEIGLSEVISPSDQSVKLIKLLTESSELPVQITVAVGFPKGDKLDFIVEKSTELGATAIWSAPFKASVSKWDKKKLTKKQEKLEKVALGAAEQSRRQMIPELQLFEQFLIAYEESAKMGEKTMFKQALTEMSLNQKVLIIFGPEGGISPDEITKFTDLGAKMIGLGPRILRAETAPLYALSSISAYFELL